MAKDYQNMQNTSLDFQVLNILTIPHEKTNKQMVYDSFFLFFNEKRSNKIKYNLSSVNLSLENTSKGILPPS